MTPDKYQPFLCALGLQGFEPFLHGLEIVALPHAAHSGGRYAEAPLSQLVGDPHLTPGRLLHRDLDHRLLDIRPDAVFEHRLAPRDLLQRRFSAFFV